MRHKVDTPVANHFNLSGHSREGNFGSKSETDLLRLEREAF